MQQETERAHYLIDFAIRPTSVTQSEKMLIIATRWNGIGKLHLLASLPQSGTEEQLP